MIRDGTRLIASDILGKEFLDIFGHVHLSGQWGGQDGHLLRERFHIYPIVKIVLSAILLYFFIFFVFFFT